jgi:hypothetical protein
MQVQSTHSTRTIPLSSVISGSLGSNRVSLPVPRSQALYARFKHVSGRPDPSGGGHTLSKLRSLDNLIDRLVRMKETRASDPASTAELKGLSDESIDAMISDLSQRLHSAFLKAEANPFLSPGSSTGLVADISL